MENFLCFMRLALFITSCYTMSVKRDLRCGSDTVLTQNNGEIISHAGFEFGHHYGKNLNCSWTIRSPFGQYVEVVAENFSIYTGYYSGTCYGDYLELFDGPNIRSKSLGRFCGSNFTAITSTGNTLTIQFVTDSYNQYQGFKLFYNFTNQIIHTCPNNLFRCDDGFCIQPSYKCDNEDDCGDDSDEMNCPVITCSTSQFTCNNKRCMPLGWLCDGDNDCGDNSDEMTSNCNRYTTTPSYWRCGQRNFTGITGTLHSPHYPLAYDATLFCRYYITAPSWTHSLSFAFNSNFSIEYDSICSYDSVKIYTDFNSYTHGPYCGRTAPPSFAIPRNHAIVEFNTDGSGNYMGFELTWSAT